jgi:hypothetical protein
VEVDCKPIVTGPRYRYHRMIVYPSFDRAFAMGSLDRTFWQFFLRRQPKDLALRGVVVINTPLRLLCPGSFKDVFHLFLESWYVCFVLGDSLTNVVKRMWVSA